MRGLFQFLSNTWGGPPPRRRTVTFTLHLEGVDHKIRHTVGLGETAQVLKTSSGPVSLTVDAISTEGR